MSSAAIRLTAFGTAGKVAGVAPTRGSRAGAAAIRRAGRPAADPSGSITRYEWRGSAMGLPVWLAVAAPGPSALNAARARLTELVDRWAPAGSHSEVARLNTYQGVLMSVSLDTVLLAQLLVRGPQRRGVWVDVRHGRVGFAGDHPLDVTGPAVALASDLVISDAWESGALDVSLRLGAVSRTVVGAAGGMSGDRQALLDTAVVTANLADLDRPPAAPWPADGPRSVTVVADRAWRAHALATTLLGMPVSRATALLAGAGLAARLVRPDESVLDIGDFAA
jgi:hypothetical protein